MRLLIALCCTAVLTAADPWPAQVDLGGESLGLRGTGRLTWMWYRVYDVALHLAPGADALDDRPRRIAFRYLRGFTAADLAKATTSTVRERIGEGPRDEIERGLAAINALWPAVTTGDELVVAYDPASGTTVSLNGRALGVVPGAAFARTLFAVWLGPDPVDDDLRDGLLGR